jgi:uncharacterized protein YndB with AHSA1/START domain
MNEKQTDWTCFKKRIVINKPVREVYLCLATKSRIEKWFLEKADYYDENRGKRASDDPVQEGDSFSWKWNNWDFEEEGKILNANAKDQISFTFGKGGNVHIQLNEKNGSTELVLTQDDIPDDEQSKMDLFVGCATGWTFWLANLKAWLEHGITLHATGLAQSETSDLVNS